MSRIRVAIAGVGNCASALLQGIAFYGTRGEAGEPAVGLLHPELGGYGAGDIEGVAAFVVDAVASLGIDTSGAALTDTSGMSYDQVVPARVIAEVLTLATSGADPRLGPLISELPVSGLTGTLHDRFHAASTRSAAGIPRAKTGTINATIALAGTTMTRDGRLLAFTAIAYAVPREGRLEARLALDRLVAALTECGCG